MCVCVGLCVFDHGVITVYTIKCVGRMEAPNIPFPFFSSQLRAPTLYHRDAHYHLRAFKSLSLSHSLSLSLSLSLSIYLSISLSLSFPHSRCFFTIKYALMKEKIQVHLYHSGC